MVVVGLAKFTIACFVDMKQENEKAENEMFTWQTGKLKVVQLTDIGTVEIDTPDVDKSCPIRYKGYIPFALWEKEQELIVSTGSVTLLCDSEPNNQNNCIANVPKSQITVQRTHKSYL